MKKKLAKLSGIISVNAKRIVSFDNSSWFLMCTAKV